MTFKLIAMVVLVALTAMLVQPAKAEAMDPSTIIAIASAAVGALLIVGFLVVANTRESQQTGADTDALESIVLAPEPTEEPAVLAPESIVLTNDAGGVQAQ